MKSLLASSFLFINLVGIPMWASIIGALAVSTDIDAKSKITLLIRAHSSQPCNLDILEKLGDAAMLNKYIAMAAWAYEKATYCAPKQAAFHFMLGEAVFLMGKDGSQYMKRAIDLEPNNPIFKRENEKFTKSLPLSR